MKTMDEYTAIARENVSKNLGNVCDEESTREEIAEEIFTLAYDAAIDAGAPESQASIIAGYMRTQF